MLPRPPKGRHTGRWLLPLLACLPAAALADKTDVIYMRNGDRVTCEIKRLERGQLKVSTDGMGTVYIEWEDIAQLVSKELYIVELQDGKRVQGTGDAVRRRHAAGDRRERIAADRDGEYRLDRPSEAR
jgi:hypothetical protein